MFREFNFYFVDTLTESVIGVFSAKSEAMARKIVSGFDFEKAKIAPADCMIYQDIRECTKYETYGEVVSSKDLKVLPDFFTQKVFDFDPEKD